MEGKQPKVLVTGAGGFVGRHLMEALRAGCPGWVLDAPGGRAALDVTNAAAVARWIGEGQPDIIVHLAAVTTVNASVEDPGLARRVILGGTRNLVLALQSLAPSAHLLFVSSGEVYGESLNAASPVGESALLQPVNPYAASKAAAESVVLEAAATGLSTTIARPFNHTGPGQSEAFVAPSFATQIARIEAGLAAPVIEVGDLDDERDFLDVADVVAAYRLLLERRAEPATRSVFNVCSGEPVRIGDLLGRLLSMARLRIEVRVNKDRLRRSPLRRMIGDPSRLRSLGWTPKRALDQTLADILQDRRHAVELRVRLKARSTPP
jgi:GDP-4-dehydro-6-deoxy-D-mannose reductase